MGTFNPVFLRTSPSFRAARSCSTVRCWCAEWNMSGT